MMDAGLILAAATSGGTALTYLYDRHAPLLVRLAAGTCTGLAALSFVAYLLAAAFGVSWAPVLVAAVLTGLPAVFATVPGYRRQLRTALASNWTTTRRAVARVRAATFARLVIGLSGAVALWGVIDRSMILRPDGIYTGIRHSFGDLPFHLATVSRFVADNNVPPEHPAFAGVPFTYPFLSDFLSALMVAAGAELRTAIVLPALLGVFSFAVLIYAWALDLTDDRLAAWLAPVLVLMGGGLGWIVFLQEASQHPANLWSFVRQLPHDYTIGEQGWRWGNVITALLIPQRGLQLALPLAVVIFRQWWLADREAQSVAADDARGPTGRDVPTARRLLNGPSHERRMWAAGVVAGLLPLIHGHSYLVVMGLASCLVWLTGSRRGWLRFFVAAITIGAPAILWLAFAGSAQSSSFVGWAFGWDRRDQNVLVFWLANTGAVIPLILWAVLSRHGRQIVGSRLRRFYLPFLLCFVVPNVVRLAPWIWDNVKILVYWFLASAPIVALILAHWYRRGSWRRALACALFVSLTAAGALDLWRVLSGAALARVLDKPAVEFATLVASTTEPTAMVLHAPIHNSPVVLTGRRSFMGYPGHLWTHGLSYRSRELELRRIYRGGRDAASLIDRHRIDYVVVGPDERRFEAVNDAFFSRFPLAGEQGTYRLFRTGAVPD